jgi:hypothetical protein
MLTKIVSKKVLIILSIIIVLFLAIFLPIYFLVIKKKSSNPKLCKYYMVTFPFQTSNVIDNMIEIEITDELKSMPGMSQFINIINNTTTRKPCHVSWFNTENDINTNHNNKQHYIKNIIINNNKIIITFEETTLNDTNPFPLHIHYYYDCINNVNSCDYLKKDILIA